MLKDSDKFYRDLGDRIKEERIKKGKSQEDVATHLNLTRTSIINLEKGRHRPSIYQLLQIAEYFNIDYTQLLPMNPQYSYESKVLQSNDLENMIIDQEIVGEDTKKAILDFLSSIKK